MGKKNDDFDELDMDLNEDFVQDISDEGFEDDMPPVAPAPQRRQVARKAAAADVDDEGFEEESAPEPKKGRKKQGAPTDGSKRKNMIAAVAIGAIMLVCMALFFYLTSPKSPQTAMMSPFDEAPPVQTALTQPTPAPAPVMHPQGVAPEAPQGAMDNGPAMAESPAEALAGGEVSLEHQKIQAATQQAVSTATQDLSNQVLAMGVQIADLQARLEASANKSSCDTNAIVEELRKKMKEDAAAEKTSSSKAETRAESKPSKSSQVAKSSKKSAPKPAATEGWKVLGLSPDRAVLVTAKGEQVVVGVGDVVSGVTVKKIDAVSGVVVTSDGTVK